MDEHARLVGDRAAGAVVTFAGVVRDHDHGRPVRELEYVGHPTADAVLAAVVAEVVAGSPVDAVAVSHRLGHLAIGDVALAVAVSAAHRGEAFAVCARLVDEVKDRLPVWKHQHFDGRHLGVGGLPVSPPAPLRTPGRRARGGRARPPRPDRRRGGRPAGRATGGTWRSWRRWRTRCAGSGSARR